MLKLSALIITLAYCICFATSAFAEKIWTMQPTAGNFKGWYLDFDNNVQSQQEGNWTIARNLILTKQVGSGVYWKVTPHNQGHTIQPTAGNFKGWYLDFDNNVQSQQEGNWTIARNLILTKQVGSGVYWKVTPHNERHTIQPTAGNFKGWYLDFDNNVQSQQEGNWTIARNLILTKQVGSGVYWKIGFDNAPGGNTPQLPGMERFPITKSEHTELRDHRRAKTSIRLSSNGFIEATTRVWTAARSVGFHGGGVIYFRDSNENTIGSVTTPIIGVDGSYVGTSDRTVNWQHNIGEKTAMNVHSIHIEHTHQPRILIKERTEDVVDIVKKLCPNSIDYKQVGPITSVSCK